MSNKPTLLVEAPFYEMPEKVSSRYRSSPYAEHLEKSKVYFATKIFAEYIVVIEPRYDFGLAKANKRTCIYRGNLINAEHSLENNRKQSMVEAIGLKTLLWLC